MFDGGFSHVLGRIAQEKYFNWIRRNRRPRGVRDGFHKGVRLTATVQSRIIGLFFALLIFAIVYFVWFWPVTPDTKFPAVDLWALRVVSLPVGGLGLVIVLDCFNTWVLVNEHGVRRQNPYWQQTFLRWSEIDRIHYKGSDEFWFGAGEERKLIVSLSYNGLEDMRDYTQKYLRAKLGKFVGNLIDGA